MSRSPFTGVYVHWSIRSRIELSRERTASASELLSVRDEYVAQHACFQLHRSSGTCRTQRPSPSVARSAAIRPPRFGPHGGLNSLTITAIRADLVALPQSQSTYTVLPTITVIQPHCSCPPSTCPGLHILSRAALTPIAISCCRGCFTTMSSRAL